MTLTIQQWTIKLAHFEGELTTARAELELAALADDVEGMSRALAARDRAQACADVLWDIIREGGI